MNEQVFRDWVNNRLTELNELIELKGEHQSFVNGQISALEGIIQGMNTGLFDEVTT